MLAPGAGTAHADSGEESGTAAFWADPDSVSSAAARRAVVDIEDGDVDAGHVGSAPWVLTTRPADETPSGSAVATHQSQARPAPSTPIGSAGPAGGSVDAGPSIAQPAILSAALIAVLWLWQRLRGGVCASERVHRLGVGVSRIA